jgi:hypothetical protein
MNEVLLVAVLHDRGVHDEVEESVVFPPLLVSHNLFNMPT